MHSHLINYPAGSKQQQVTCYDGENDDDHWIVKPARTGEVVSGAMVSDGMTIRLEHFTSQRNLHSHHIPAHVADGQNEVSCCKVGEQLWHNTVAIDSEVLR